MKRNRSSVQDLYLTFCKSRPRACVTRWWVRGILLLFGVVHGQRIRWIPIEAGRGTVRPTVRVREAAVTGGPGLPRVKLIPPGRLLCLMVCDLEASGRLIQMRLGVAAGRVSIYRHRVGKKRRTVASKGATLRWCRRSRRARTWRSPWERAHVSPIVGELVQPGYVGSITPQVGEIQRLRGGKIQKRTNIAGI